MKRTRATVLAAAMLALPSLSVAAQDAQPTAANAHGFLKEVMTKGSSSAYLHDPLEGRISSLDSSGCSSRFGGARSDYPSEQGRAFWDVAFTFTVDWGKVTELSVDGRGIVLKGAIPYQGRCATNSRAGCEPTYGGTRSSINLTLESSTLASRVLNAMTVLKESCDTTGRFGF